MWCVLESVVRGEQADPEAVRKSILKILPNCEVFVPAAVSQVGVDRVVHYLMEGYIFVKSSRPPSDYFKLEGSKYVQNVLLKPGSRNRAQRVATIEDQRVLVMREQLRQQTNQGIGVGDTVLIVSGPYKNITAVVFEDIPEDDKVQVFIKLRSKQSLVTFPRSFLKVVERSPHSTIVCRARALQDWVGVSMPILTWGANLNPLQTTLDTFEKVSGWATGYELLHNITNFQGAPHLIHLKDRVKALDYWDGAFNKIRVARNFVGFFNQTSSVSLDVLDNVFTKTSELIWLEDVLKRTQILWDEVAEMARHSIHENDNMNHNVVVDGHNLAFRCFYAHGMADLKDSKGRPTGMILGFLRSLASLRKRFQDSTLIVTWDGSSQRRKSKFGAYKANRPVSGMVQADVFNPIDVLMSLLPSLGVKQVWNPCEEADDVIATLVRGPLKDDTNIILSTDRDMWQLVSTNTTLLVPAVGSRNEIMFDPERVKAEVGVAPNMIVQLRAFYGDSSDNIPGVPRVPKKVLKDLVLAHGSVDGVYKSGLAGITKSQYERLRLAEPQVRINVELATLLDVDLVTLAPDVDPDYANSVLADFDINTNLSEPFIGSVNHELNRLCDSC